MLLIACAAAAVSVAAAAPASTCCTADAYSALAIEQKAAAGNSLHKLESYLDVSQSASLVVVTELGSGDQAAYLTRADLKMV